MTYGIVIAMNTAGSVIPLITLTAFCHPLWSQAEWLDHRDGSTHRRRKTAVLIAANLIFMAINVALLIHNLWKRA